MGATTIIQGTLVTNEPLAGLGRGAQIGGDCPPAMRNPQALDDLPEEALDRLGAELGVRREDGEELGAFRARVEVAWNDDAAVDAAVPMEQPNVPPTLGGMRLG
jgi:hypothetical protein